MQIIIGNKSNSKIQKDKLELEIDKLSKIEIKLKIDKIIIFFKIDLIINSISKLYIIAYNSKAKMFLITYFYFIDNQYINLALLN